MSRTKTKDDVTRIGGIATLSSDGQYSYIVLPRSWNKKRVFVFLKSNYDEMRRQEERRSTKTVGEFARGLIEGGKNKNGS
jgi:hypothetical protein